MPEEVVNTTYLHDRTRQKIITTGGRKGRQKDISTIGCILKVMADSTHARTPAHPHTLHACTPTNLHAHTHTHTHTTLMWTKYQPISPPSYPNCRDGRRLLAHCSISLRATSNRGLMTPHLLSRPLRKTTILPARWSSTISNSPI